MDRQNFPSSQEQAPRKGHLETNDDPKKTLAQPWKEFVTVAEPGPMTLTGEGSSIRLIDGRVDGKVVGG